MSERPGGSGRPERRPDDGGRPGYDWLWGEGSDGVPQAGQAAPQAAAAPEPTQRIAARPGRQATGPGPGEIAPEPGRPSGPGGPRGGSGRGGGGGGGQRPPRASKPWTVGRRIRWAIATLLVLVLIWAALMIWAGVSAWHSVAQVPWEPSGARPGSQPGTTYLLVGSDSRKGLTKKERIEYHTGNDAGQRTDTIMLVHTGGGHTLVMSIPRDSVVPIPGHGTTKINAAFAYGGPKLLVKTIEQNTGIRIDAYVETGLGGLPHLVDSVGGITICPKTAMNDPLAGLNIKKGCQHADGQVALAFARSRHALATGDLGRAADQRAVISGVMHKLKSPSIMLNPFKLHSLGGAIGGTISVGKGMSIWSAYHLYTALRALTSGNAMSCGTPISDMYVHWDPTRSKQMFGYIIRDQVGSIPKSLCTPTGLPKSVTG